MTDRSRRAGAVRVESRECLLKCDVQEPTVMPEGNVLTSANPGSGQALVALEFTGEDFAQVGVFTTMGMKPLFLGRCARVMHSVNKHEEETMVHVLQVLDTEAALFLAFAHVLPGHQAT